MKTEDVLFLSPFRQAQGPEQAEGQSRKARQVLR